MSNSNRFIFQCFLLVLTIPLAACAPRFSGELSKKTLTFSLPDDVKSLDPAVAYDTVAMDVVPLVAESLYQYSYVRTPLELEPLLAASAPEISKDGLLYTIHIRRGVRWPAADFLPAGRELVAADFLYAWKRLASPELASPGTWIFDGKVAGWDQFRSKVAASAALDRAAALSAPVDGFQAPDPYTIRVRLLHADPQFAHVLAMAYTAPLPREVFDKYGLFALNERVVGTGPFALRDFVRGSRITLAKNPVFRGEAYPSNGDATARAEGLTKAAGAALPMVEEVTFLIFKEDQPRWLSFLRGQLDVSGIPKDNFSSVVDRGELRGEMAAKGIQFHKLEQASTYLLYFNMRDPVLGPSAKLRQAISLAVDREAFLERFRNGRGAAANSLVPRVLPGHPDRAFPFAYDLARARKVLTEAGFPEGKGLATLRLDVKGTSTNFRQQGEFLRDCLAHIGVRVEVVANTMPGYLEKERNGNLQLTFGVWDSDYPDAENFLALLYSRNRSPGPNLANFSDPVYDRIYEKVAALPPSLARDRLILAAEDLAFRELPVAPLFYPFAYSVAQGWVKNFRPNIQVINHMKYFDVDLGEKAELGRKL